jgi:ABC-type amino acid transport substrate-binding protein
MEYILSTPIYRLNTSLFLRRDDAESGLYRGAESFHGKTIGIMRGLVFSKEFEDAKREGNVTV